MFILENLSVRDCQLIQYVFAIHYPVLSSRTFRAFVDSLFWGTDVVNYPKLHNIARSLSFEKQTLVCILIKRNDNLDWEREFILFGRTVPTVGCLN